MPLIETTKLIAMVITIIALLNFPFIIKKRKDFLKFIPGLTLHIMSFIFSGLNDLFELPLLDFLEILSLLIGSILISIAIMIEIKLIKSNNRNNVMLEGIEEKT